ncbi:MAG TPA: alkaline phosphatase family protein [Gaiella sp.]|nr:alkaline phosphatase family protein [Gaiella sp.]
MSTIRPPERGRRCFDQLPATIEQLLTGQTTGPALDQPILRRRVPRVALVFLDGFGWRLLERQSRHPLVERARSDGLVTQLTSQFPSTTTAHVTTIHTGLTVAEHGLYEWHVLEPTLNRLITPLLFSYAGDPGRDTLVGTLDPEEVFPKGSFYERLATHGIRSTVVQPAEIACSSPSRPLFHGIDVLPFSTLVQGLASAAAALEPAPAYAHVYVHAIDSLMHTIGPDDARVDLAFASALTAVERARFPAGTLVLLTADHGMSPVDPARTAYVNELWPDLAGCLETGADDKPLAPAGSCRDLFLHVRDGHLDEVRDELAARLGGFAEVMAVETLVANGIFADPSQRLRERLANLVVLPRYGEAVYWHEPGRFVQHLRGQHGGLSPEEMEIPLLAWVA